MTLDILEQYRDGTLTAHQALHALCSEYGECVSELEPLEIQQKELRKAIEHIVLREGTQEIKNFGRLSMVSAATTSRYDTKQLDNLVRRLMQIGEYDIAQQIADCKRETQREGYLKIEREKL